MVAFQHGRRPENVGKGDQQRNQEQGHDAVPQTVFPYFPADALRGNSEKRENQNGKIEQDTVKSDKGKLVGHRCVAHKKFAYTVKGFQRLKSGKEAAVLTLVRDSELVSLSKFKRIVKTGIVVQHEKSAHHDIGGSGEEQLFSKPERKLSAL